MPGSRSGEIWRLAGLFGKAAKLLSDRIGGLEVTVPAVPRLADMARAAVKNWQVPARVVTDPEEKDAAFRTARAALTKSGTSTLELAVAGVPMVAGYRVSLAEELVARALIEVPSIILANLVLGGNVVPELMQRQCTPVALASALLPLMSDTRERRLQTEAFARLDAIMEIGRAVPSDRAAAAVLQCAGRIAPPRRETVAPPPYQRKLHNRRKSRFPIAYSRLAAITGVHGYVPPDVLTNAELARMVDTSDEWIIERTGIKERHILKGKGLGTSHMGAEGGARSSGEDRHRSGEVDLLICATTTPDFVFPSTANLICDMAGIHSIGSFDVQAACSGFVYALTVASQFIETGKYAQNRGGRRRQDVGDHRLYRPRDLRAVRRRRRSGADGAEQEGYGIMDALIRSDGSGMKHLHQKAGGSRMPPTAEKRRQAPALRPSGRSRGLQIRHRAHGRSRRAK